jgi:hypothetical protein
MARYLDKENYHNTFKHMMRRMHVHVRIDKLGRQCTYCDDAIQCLKPVPRFVWHEVRRKSNTS